MGSFYFIVEVLHNSASTNKIDSFRDAYLGFVDPLKVSHFAVYNS